MRQEPRRIRIVAVPLLAFALGCGLTAALAWFPRHLLRSQLPLLRPDGSHQGYAVVQTGGRLQGVDRNISGLTYSHSSDSLFAVINRPERVVEIDLCGRVLRILPAEFGDDLEAISHVEGDLFVIASERGNVIWGARINSRTMKVEPVTTHTLSVSFNDGDNEGIEGLSWDHTGQRLFLANEKNTLKIVEVRGLENLLQEKPGSLAIRVWERHQSLAGLVGDVASVSFNESWQSMALLSHESRRVYRLDGRNAPQLLLRLDPGHHGLKAAVEQPEGLAFGPDGSIFIVAEPNLFHRFLPTGKTASRGRPLSPERVCPPLGEGAHNSQ